MLRNSRKQPHFYLQVACILVMKPSVPAGHCRETDHSAVRAAERLRRKLALAGTAFRVCVPVGLLTLGNSNPAPAHTRKPQTSALSLVTHFLLCKLLASFA